MLALHSERMGVLLAVKLCRFLCSPSLSPSFLLFFFIVSNPHFLLAPLTCAGLTFLALAASIQSIDGSDFTLTQ